MPSGITIRSSRHRSQHQNKVEGIKLLKQRLVAVEMGKLKQQQADRRDNASDPTFGHQIRSYVLTPYRLVKDCRTQHETSQVRESEALPLAMRYGV
jgi:peptide chain release factor 2